MLQFQNRTMLFCNRPQVTHSPLHCFSRGFHRVKWWNISLKVAFYVESHLYSQFCTYADVDFCLFWFRDGGSFNVQKYRLKLRVSLSCTHHICESFTNLPLAGNRKEEYWMLWKQPDRILEIKTGVGFHQQPCNGSVSFQLKFWCYIITRFREHRERSRMISIFLLLLHMYVYANLTLLFPPTQWKYFSL